jgi:hypothetical protein
MMLNEEWVTETARLIKQREHAIQMLARWQQKLDEANAVLATYAAVQQEAQETEPEQAPVPA